MKSYADIGRPPIENEEVWCPDGTLLDVTLHVAWVVLDNLDKYYPKDENPEWIDPVKYTCGDCHLFEETGCPFCRAKDRMGF